MNATRAVWLGAVVLLALACGRHEGTTPASAAREAGVIARVDGASIDGTELTPTGDARRDRRALNALIARKLAAREARVRGLDAEALRRETAAREEEILRDALLASLRDALVLDEAELREHYEKTKRRHAERRLTLRRRRFSSEADAHAAKAAALGEAETIGPAAVEGLPADVIPDALRLQSPGERSVIVHESGASLVELVAIEPAAVRAFEDVRGEVEKSLRTLRGQQAFREEIERLRASARIEVDESALAASNDDAG